MTRTALHQLLLLSDSALPLGSFAFSSGLESHLAHLKHLSTPPTPPPDGVKHNPSRSSANWQPPPGTLVRFLRHSIHNAASSLLPFLLAGWHHPSRLGELDDLLDAATACTVARRASVAQGRALAGLWSKALRGGCGRVDAAPTITAAVSHAGDDAEMMAACDAVDAYAARLAGAAAGTAAAARGTAGDGIGVALLQLQIHGHLPPLFGAVGRAMGLGADEAAYVFLLNHAKAVLSAAVRAGVLGPYQSQGILAGNEVRAWVSESIEEVRARGRGRGEGDEGAWAWGLLEEAGVSVPAMDLWMGRHELLYSRIFNS